MKYDKTTILGLTACVLLFLLFTFLGARERSRMAAEASARAAAAAEAVPRDESPPRTSAAEPGPAPDPAPQPAAAPAGPSEPVAASGPPGDPEVLREPWPPSAAETMRLSAVASCLVDVDSAGGGVTGVVLSRYDRDLASAEGVRQPVRLGRQDHPFLALDLRASGVSLGAPEVVEEAPERCTLRRRNPEGIVVTESWEVAEAAPYRVHYRVRFENQGTAPLLLQHLAIESGCVPASVASRSLKAAGGGAGGISIAFLDAGRPRFFTPKKIAKLGPGEQRILAARPAKWMGVHSQYFVLAVVAGGMDDAEAFAGCQVDLRTGLDSATEGSPPQPWYGARGLLPRQLLEPGRELELAFTGVAGPKEYDLLHRIGGRLDTVIGMDTFLFWHPEWMGFLTRWLLRLLVWLRDLFGVSWGYGLAIIVITVAVKVLFWPLTHHSTKSMRKMQQLQPQLKELRERYKSDPQKLYRKQAELFKANKVSQFGGCLPILLQLPVFFALFITFRSAIELRHASFLWAADLSMPDDILGLPIRPLALLMGGTMLLQQRLTPSAGDPQQQRMMMFMSVFFIFLFYGMPSGLNLYWTVNQMLSIVQTLVTRQIEKKSEITASGTQKAPGKPTPAKTAAP